jgi:fluoroacetyl-CoA thioesterase
MKSSLVPGVSASHAFRVSVAQTVPHLPIGNELFSDIPDVLATANMVAMMEGTATKALAPHMDTGEGSLGILVSVTHLAATVPGQTVTVTAEVTSVEGRKVTFKVLAHDGLDKIGEGMHQRMIVPWERFKSGVIAKAARLSIDRPKV